MPSSPEGEEVPQLVTQLVCTADRLCQYVGFGYGNEPWEIDLLPLEHIVEEFRLIFPRAKAKSTDEFLSLAHDFIGDAQMIADQVFGELLLLDPASIVKYVRSQRVRA